MDLNSDEPFTIPILGSESIIVGHQMTQLIAKECLSLLPKTTTWVIVTDSNVKIWLDSLMNAFKQVNVLNFVISPGEESKCRVVKAQIEDWMLSHKCTRDTAMIALGGGVVGDLTGMYL
jgi:pentafunctional AROM polypeptide